MTTVVFDASVIVKWIFADRAEESQALQILQFIKESLFAVVQPPHWLAEAAAGYRASGCRSGSSSRLASARA